jgi:pectate lyase
MPQPLFGAEPSPQNQDRARMKAVISFADNVLKDAADRYHRPPSPLLANGVNVFTREQLEWKFADGSRLVISDLAAQQNLIRVLIALSRLTGDPKYGETAKAGFAYCFAHFQDRGGLLDWGGHRFVDLRSLKAFGTAPNDPGVHELKNIFPFYELMYEVNPKATIQYIIGFWNAHVYNWRTLEISRHGEYGHAPEPKWSSPFEDSKPYLETKGLSFLDAGNDLIYSGAMLYKLTGDTNGLVWSKRLAAQYVKARNPQTQLGAYQFTQPRKLQDTNDDNITLSWFGDRAKRQFGPDFPSHLVLEATILLHRLALTIYSENALMQLELGPALGPDGKEFLEWTRQGMAAFARFSYIPEKNQFRPLLTDGTDLTGFTLKRNGYYGKAGTKLDAYEASPEFMISYARGFMLTGDANLWTVARGIARGNGLGDIGSEPGKEVVLNLTTTNNDPFALFSLLDIYRQTKNESYLQLARVVGNNIVRDRFHHGYFTRYHDQVYANIDAIEPYALLALEAAIQGVPDKIPHFVNGSGFVDAEYLFPNGNARRTKDAILYRIRKSGSPDPKPTERDPNAEQVE